MDGSTFVHSVQPPFNDYSFLILVLPLFNLDLLSCPLSIAAMLLPLSYLVVCFYLIEPPLDITPGLPYTEWTGTPPYFCKVFDP